MAAPNYTPFDERGASAILALIVMSFLTIIGGAFIFLSNTELTIATQYRDGVAAQYLAEAGAQRANVELAVKKNYNYKGTSYPEKLGEGQFSVTVTKPWSNEPNYYKIVSIGSVNDATRQVVVKINPDLWSQYDIFAGSDLNLLASGVEKPNTGIATIGSNQDIEIDASVVEGNLWAHGKVFSWLSLVQGGGTVKEGSDGVKKVKMNRLFNYIDDKYSSGSDLEELSLPSWWDIVIHGRKRLDLSNGNYYIDGDYTIKSGVVLTGSGSIHVKGNFNIELGGALAGDVIVIADKDINLEASGGIDKAVFIAKKDINIFLTDPLGFTSNINAKFIAGEKIGVTGSTIDVLSNTKFEELRQKHTLPCWTDETWNYQDTFN